MVLDIDGGSRNPGTRVIMWHKKESDRDNQLWYEDHATGTIRSKLHDLCLDIDGGGTLVVNNFQPGDPNQQWMRSDCFIRNRMMQNKSIDIARGSRDAGATLCSWDHHGGQNQSFDFEIDGSPSSGGAQYASGQQGSYPAYGASQQRRDFHIVSELNGKVIDIERGNTGPGASVIVYKRKHPPGRNQLWYTDQQGVIRSALNDFALQGHDGDHQMKMHPFDGRQEQQWRIQDRRIANPSGLCLDIRGASQADGAAVIAYQYKGANNQHWRIEYV